MVSNSAENSSEDIDSISKLKRGDTLDMEPVSDEDIKQYKKGKTFKKFRKSIFNKKVFIVFMTVVVLAAIGMLGYRFILAPPVDASRIMSDIEGTKLLLPKGTVIEVKKGKLEDLKINGSLKKEDEGREVFSVNVTVIDESIEANGNLSVVYKSEGKNQWSFEGVAGNFENVQVKPLVSMDDDKLIEELKNFKVKIASYEKLIKDNAKTFNIIKKDIDLESGTEVAYVKVSFDNNITATEGIIKCSAEFSDEKWKVARAEKDTESEFKLQLSPDFSDSTIIDLIKNNIKDEYIKYDSLFGGEKFIITPSTTKEYSIVSKSLDENSGIMTVNVKRQSEAGAVKTVLNTTCSIKADFESTVFVKSFKSEVQQVTVQEVTSDYVIATIGNAEMEGDDSLFWWSDNHKITEKEAKSITIDKIVVDENNKALSYVYGVLKYEDGKKEKSSSMIIAYELQYQESKGYVWKLKRVIGESSSDYKTYKNNKQ